MREVRNYMPMAWIHAETRWRSVVNLPYVEVPNPLLRKAGDNEVCHQGYSPVILGDPGHWYSNAARGLEKGSYREATSEESTPLLKFIALFRLKKWLHPLQWVGPDIEDAPRNDQPAANNANDDATSNGSKKGAEKRDRATKDKGQKYVYNLIDNTIYDHFNYCVSQGRRENFPAVVVLRKVIHKDNEEETNDWNRTNSVEWDRWNTSDPNTTFDLDYQETKSIVEEIRQRMDIIATEVKSHLDKVDSIAWPANAEENDKHQQHSQLLTDIVQALQREANKPNSPNVAAYRNLVEGLEEFQKGYETRRKHLLQGSETMAEERPVLDEVVKQETQKTKFACTNLDRLRRKRIGDINAARTKRDTLQIERDGLAGQERASIVKELALMRQNKTIGKEKSKLENTNARLEREVAWIKKEMEKHEATIKELQRREDELKKRRRESPDKDADQSKPPSNHDNGDENKALKDKNKKLQREVTRFKRAHEQLEATTKNSRLERIRAINKEREDHLSKRRRESQKETKKKGDDKSKSPPSDDDDDEDDGDDDEDDQPPKKKPKVTALTDDMVDKRKGKSKAQDNDGSTFNLQSSRNKQTDQSDTGNSGKNSGGGRKSPTKPPATKSAATADKSTTKSGDKATTNADTEPTTTTKSSPKKPAIKKNETETGTKSPSKPAAADKPTAKPPTKSPTKSPTKPAAKATTKSTTKAAASVPPTTRVTRFGSSSVASSPAPAPSPSPTPAKPKGKPGPKPKAPTEPKDNAPAKATVKPKPPAKPPAKAPVKAPAQAPAKTPAKAPAKTPKATTKKATATATAAGVSSPASTASQPTRASRRQKKEDVEVEKVSDPEKAAKKGKRKM
ncbi:hypothetical protein ES702_04540 [subsurface metagenome]